MPCSCRNTVCECRGVCHCCPWTCYCIECYDIRVKLRTESCSCGGRGICPKSRFLTRPNQSSSRASEKRTNIGTCAHEAPQGSSMASRRCVPETSQSPPTESKTFDESLIFQMDDIDTPPPPQVTASTFTTTGNKCRDFKGSSHFNSNTSASRTVPSAQREPQNRVHRCYQHNPDAAGLKKAELPKCEKPISNTLQKPDVTNLKLREARESEMSVTTQVASGCPHRNPCTSTSEIEESLLTRVPPLRSVAATDLNRTEICERQIPTTTQGVLGCLHHNHNTNIPNLEDSHVTEISPERKLQATGLKWAESPESEMMITKDIPGFASKQGESQATDNASYAVSPSTDEFGSVSLPSSLTSDDSSSSSLSVSPRSLTPTLSTSAPAIYDFPEPTCELKSSDKKTPVALGTSETSPTSNMRKFETLRLSDSRPIDKSRTLSESSSSIEVLPDNIPNGARYDTFQGEPGIPTIFVAPSQLNSREMEAESSQPGASQTRSTSNSLKLPSPEASKTSRRTSSESASSIETLSRGPANDNSEDEAPTNKSPKKSD